MKKPQRTNRKSLIVSEHLTCGELARLCGVTSSAIRKRMTRGVYQNTIIDESSRRGFPDKSRPRLIYIFDPAIPQEVRHQWKTIQRENLGLPPVDNREIMNELAEMKVMMKTLLSTETEKRGN